MLTATLRAGTELSQSEKADIINRIVAIQNSRERDFMRKSLAKEYGVSTGSINSFVAHETMRRQRAEQSPKAVKVKSQTQTNVYRATSLVQITEDLRQEIISQFSSPIQNSAGDDAYDFYQDIDIISDDLDIESAILEQFLTNRYPWLREKLELLKKGKILRDEDKTVIRLYVAEGIDEKSKKSRRKEMAKQYGVSIFVISAITAWKIDEVGGVILRKDRDIFGELSTSEAVAQSSIKSSQELETHQAEDSGEKPLEGDKIEKAESAEGERLHTKEDAAFVCELAGDFDLSDDSKRAIFLQDVFDLFPNATIEDVKKIIPAFPDDKAHANTKRSGEGMGALVNYDNEIKNKWRQELKKFIDENTDIQGRSSMKVLCLPGIECLEIPRYIELGFKPENIIGVEAGIVKGKKDSELIARFQANASKYGIQTRIGKLEKILETEETLFHVVSLDFLGQMCPVYLEILGRVKYAEFSIVVTNFLGRRENNNTKLDMITLESLHDGYGRIITNGFWVPSMEKASLQVAKKGIGISAVIADQISNSFHTPNITSASSQIDTIRKAFLSFVAQHKKSSGESGEGLTQEDERMAILSILDRLSEFFAGQFPQSDRLSIKGHMYTFLRLIFLKSINIINLHKSYKYHSGRSPFMTDMFVFSGVDLRSLEQHYSNLLELGMILVGNFNKEMRMKPIPGNLKSIRMVIMNQGNALGSFDVKKVLSELLNFRQRYSKVNVFSHERELIE